MSAGHHRFEIILFDASMGHLTKDGHTIALSQRAAGLLRALIAAAGQPVSKAELLEKAWPGQIVEEGNLTVQIAALRKALGAGPDGNDWIVTVPRVGYRLVRQVALEPVSTAAVVLPSLVVLPFENIGGDPEQEYFADGIAGDIITALSRFKHFAVIARNSSFAYKGKNVGIRQLEAQLGVRYALGGHVRKGNDRLRISCQLMDVRGGSELWAQNFDGAMGDVFDFQDQITESVVARVAPQIQRAEFENSRRERPHSVQAYDIGLKALAKILTEKEPENAGALVLLEKALTIDPNDARLVAYSAWALEHRIVMGWPPYRVDDRERCVALARHGLELAGDDGYLVGYCAIALLQAGREYDLGMAVLEQAVKAHPNNLTVVIEVAVAHLHCGSIEQCMNYLQRAMRLSPRDPFSHVALSAMAHAYMVLGKFGEAIDWATRSMATNPNFDPAFWILAAANAHLGNLAEARRYRETLQQIAPGVTIARIKAGQPAKSPVPLASILDGLRAAGLPE